MIKDFFFVVKMLALCVLVSLGLQTKIGEKKLEDGFHEWVKTSILVDHLQGVLDGGVALAKTSYSKAHKGISSLLTKVSRRSEKRERALSFDIKRYNETEDGEDLDADDAPLPTTKIVAPTSKNMH